MQRIPCGCNVLNEAEDVLVMKRCVLEHIIMDTNDNFTTSPWVALYINEYKLLLNVSGTLDVTDFNTA